MSERNDEQFDAMLGGFFKDSLEPHVGRSERYFRRYLDDAARAAWKQRTWLIGAFFTGMAASVAMLWASPLFRAISAPSGTETRQVSDSGEKAPPSPMLPAVERVVQSHTTDEGVMVLGGDTPVRVLRRHGTEQTRWLDERQKVQAEQVTPRDDLVIIKMPTY
ncbi:MAG TPA: hypothetical protein VLJ39_21040 [Tepidisphaeraceae bacterium]|jgi:hypothetical protein|nr:hypothetical protein [Tepidisphaeraceae bacterium]